MPHYQATFTDSSGTETTTIHNDGETLRLLARGVEFTGNDFDALEPRDGTKPKDLRRFHLFNRCLCSCRIECTIPIPVICDDLPAKGNLEVRLDLGRPTMKRGLDSEDIQITLTYSGNSVSSSVKSGLFEIELLEIQRQLPCGVFMKACINCLYSDYSPYGQGLFGCMMCFRNLKSEYLKVKSKDEFWSVHDRADRQVQETYLCSEFERRIPGTGYRG